MAIKKITLPEGTNSSQSHDITIEGLNSINSISSNRGTVSVEKIVGNVATIRVSGGSYTRKVRTGGSYTPADSKNVTSSRSFSEEDFNQCLVHPSQCIIPNSISYNSGGYSGTLTRTGSSGTDAIYAGTVTRPASDTTTYAYYYQYEVTVDYTDNFVPTLTLDTTNDRTLYENDTLTLSGNVKDEDVGNVVTVRYNINGGITRAITTAISQGTNVPYSKVLTFRNGNLFDGSSEVTPKLGAGSQHTIRVWATDDQGGQSAEQVRIFYVIPNRPAKLTVEPFSLAKDLIDSDTVTITGNVTDPDGNDLTVSYKIGGGSFVEVYSGKDSAFSFDVELSSLVNGKNTITIQAKDTYGASTNKSLEITKSGEVTPLLKSVARYKLTPPNGKAEGVLLWINREVGDLDIDVDIHMGNEGDAENFVPMTKLSTAYVNDDIEEDEYSFQATGEKTNIIIQINMTRSDITSTEGITLISGVLS